MRNSRRLIHQGTRKNRFGIIDPVAGFLETNFQDQSNILRYYRYLQYYEIYPEWTRDSIHNENVFDTIKMEKLALIAEEKFNLIVSIYPKTFWIDAFRSISLRAMFMILATPYLEDIFEYIEVGTFAINKFSKLPSNYKKEKNGRGLADILPPSLLAYTKENFASDLGKFLGTVTALIIAQRYYRIVGKGGKLIKPEVITDQVFASYEEYPHDALLILPSPRLQEDKRLDEAISLYESRRNKKVGTASAGFFQNQTSILLVNADWWRLAAVGDSYSETPRTTVRYPGLNMSVFSEGYFPHPVDISADLKLLFPFSDKFRDVFSIDFIALRSMCQTVANIIYINTGFSQLKFEQNLTGDFQLTSALNERSSISQSAPQHLYDLFSRGIYKIRRSTLMVNLKSDLQKLRDIELLQAEKFVEIFSMKETPLLFHDLEPWIFYPVDNDMLVIDLIAFSSFMELCLRKITKEQGGISNIRSNIFEDQARNFLRDKLRLNDAQIPVSPNAKIVVGGRDYGDVDFCFIWRSKLIHLDMKSWQRDPGYFKGDFHAINNRQLQMMKDLIEKPSSLEKRSEQLLTIISAQTQKQEISGIINLLCVPHVEYVSPYFPKLWYGKLPRVLTPSEIAENLMDEQHFADLVAAI